LRVPPLLRPSTSNRALVELFSSLGLEVDFDQAASPALEQVLEQVSDWYLEPARAEPARVFVLAYPPGSTEEAVFGSARWQGCKQALSRWVGMPLPTLDGQRAPVVALRDHARRAVSVAFVESAPLRRAAGVAARDPQRPRHRCRAQGRLSGRRVFGRLRHPRARVPPLPQLAHQVGRPGRAARGLGAPAPLAHTRAGAAVAPFQPSARPPHARLGSGHPHSPTRALSCASPAITLVALLDVGALPTCTRSCHGHVDPSKLGIFVVQSGQGPSCVRVVSVRALPTRATQVGGRP
jgi:hypothetical protein